MYFLSKNKATFDDKAKGWIRKKALDYPLEDEMLEQLAKPKTRSFSCFYDLVNRYEALFTVALLEKMPLAKVKLFASNMAKLSVMGVNIDIDIRNGFKRTVVPFHCLGDYISRERFYALMSDNEQVIQWLGRHKDRIAQQAMPTTIRNVDVNAILLYIILLAMEGKAWNMIRQRCQRLLDGVNHGLSYARKRIPDLEFLIALSQGDSVGMRQALDKLLMPRSKAKASAFGVLRCLDFYLQPQVLFYGKLASRHGYDLGIDDEIAPKELIRYDPLDSYPNPYAFMDDYEWEAPFDFQYQWIEKFEPELSKAQEDDQEDEDITPTVCSVQEQSKIYKKTNEEIELFKIKELVHQTLTHDGYSVIGHRPEYPYCYNGFIWHSQEKEYDSLYKHPKDNSLLIVEPYLNKQENQKSRISMAEGGNPKFSPAWFQSMEDRFTENNEVRITLEQARLCKQAIKTGRATMDENTKQLVMTPVCGNLVSNS